MSTVRTIEITAKTEEEARQIVMNELNANETVVCSETISAPAKGLFGFVGKQEYKIKFSIGEKPEEKPAEMSERISKKADSEVSEEEDSSYDSEEVPVPVRSGRREWAPRREGGFRRERQDRGRRGNRRNRNDSRDGQGADETLEIPERPKEPVPEEIKNHEGYSQVFEYIRNIAANLGIEDIQLTDYTRDGAWVVEAAASDVSQLIGKRGHTLDAIQYLMNIIFNKDKEDSRIKIVLDAQGYREKRYQNLIHLASRMARKAVASHRPVELEPMSTLDRRTIHMALKDRPDVETFSKGSEPMRRVVISSMKKKNNKTGAEWQPLAIDDDVELSEKTENSSSVPMFMEEDD